MSDELKIHSVKFLGSFPAEKDCPKLNKPEYAFIGRSNVGKSSLINMITGRKEIARTSKSPGKTRSINLFEIDEAWYLADLPGYGYAKVSKTERKKWQKMLEDYMVLRPNLMTAFVLLDLRHELQKIDNEFINWLGERHIPFSIVYTKADKLRPSERRGNQKRIEEVLLETWEQLPPRFLTSSVQQTGREALLEYIAGLNRTIPR